MPRFAVALLLFLCVSAAQAAAVLPAPGERVILTIEGEVGCPNAEGKGAFDRALIETLPAQTIGTTTVWTDGVQTFTGVLLGDLLKSVCAEGRLIQARAINDYAVEIPLERRTLENAVVAYERNGEPMSVRDKGPLWIVFPWDDKAVFRAESYFSQSIWQLIHIDVMK